MTRPTLRQFNNLLSVVVIILALYIFVTPFTPKLTLWLKKQTDTTQGYTYKSAANPNPQANTKAKPIPTDNRIVIPSILLDESVKESKSISAINNGGTWRRPASSSPDTGGNTVIVAHRYTYKGTSTFYNLDKVKPADTILVYWQGKEHIYRVKEVKEVPPTATDIEAPTDSPRLTLYTCTPVWNAKNRLVVIAEPQGDTL